MDSVVAMGPLVIYTALFVLVFAESVAWLGLVVPGDLALVSAGALTITGTVDLAMLVAVAFGGTAAGYAVAYEIGRRAGPRLVASVAARPRVAHDIAVAQRTLAERGTLLIVASRSRVDLVVDTDHAAAAAIHARPDQQPSPVHVLHPSADRERTAR